VRERVGRVKERYPELRVIPRTSPERVEAMLAAGAEGAVVTFPDEAAMRDFARSISPRRQLTRWPPRRILPAAQTAATRRVR
jgi:DNA-binding transcriptional LysR family regulator